MGPSLPTDLLLRACPCLQPRSPCGVACCWPTPRSGTPSPCAWARRPASGAQLAARPCHSRPAARSSPLFCHACTASAGEGVLCTSACMLRGPQPHIVPRLPRFTGCSVPWLPQPQHPAQSRGRASTTPATPPGSSRSSAWLVASHLRSAACLARWETWGYARGGWGAPPAAHAQGCCMARPAGLATMCCCRCAAGAALQGHPQPHLSGCAVDRCRGEACCAPPGFCRPHASNAARFDLLIRHARRCAWALPAEPRARRPY